LKHEEEVSDEEIEVEMMKIWLIKLLLLFQKLEKLQLLSYKESLMFDLQGLRELWIF
jgi:hypothetical protein